MSILANIQRIKIFASCLFFIPLIALFFSLSLNNHLITYTQGTFPLSKIKFGKFECNKINNFCNHYLSFNDDGEVDGTFSKPRKFTNCSKFTPSFEFYTHVNGKSMILDGKLPQNAVKKEKPFFVIIKENKNEINKHCIKNSILYKFYEWIPEAGDIFIKIKHKTFFGISQEVYPFIDGKASISNIVRRYPFNIIFKPLMFITSIIMIFYWINYDSLLKKILPFKKKINSFTLFGILSSIFLFLHVLFLGIDNQTDLIRQLRKIVIVSFIIFEILAQFYLAKKLYGFQNILEKYMYKKIILTKIIFVNIIILATFIVLLLLATKDMGSAFNNIAEWNYFTCLLVFYLLSAIAWKKDKPSVTHR